MTYFLVGEILRANVDAQGLHKGGLYRVEGLSVFPTPFGDVVTYSLRPEGGGVLLAVNNAHLLLAAVAVSSNKARRRRAAR